MVDFIIVMYCFLIVIGPCIAFALGAYVLLEKVTNPEKTIKQILKGL